MKIAWFTPFAKQSAIGKISALICQTLFAEHQVEIWTPHSEQLIRTKVPVVSFSKDIIPDDLAEYDYIFYNFGNFAGYHREIMDAAHRIPGIVILHDQTMASFWGQYFCISEFGGDGQNGHIAYQSLLRTYYGESAAQAVTTALGSGEYPFYSHSALEGYSFLEPTIRGAMGVFTHSNFFAQRLRTLTNLPVAFSYLPCALPQPAAETEFLAPILEKAKTEGRKILVSSGIVHPVKRIDKIVDVLLAHPELSKKVCYLVIGNCDGSYGDRLKELAAGKLRGCLHMLGYQPDEVMGAALAAADLSVNLRYPNSEVCSLSLWEQMAAGKPVLVLDCGIYGEVPTDTVVRISLEEEIAGITRALQAVVHGEQKSEVGVAARNFIATQCNVETYCNTLLDFAKTVEHQANVAAFQNRVIACVGEKLNTLHLTEVNVPASYAAVIDQLSRVLGGEQTPVSTNKTMGIWLGFPYYVPNLHREGISRLMGYLVSSMLRYHPDVNAEIWCYSFNEAEARTTFCSVRTEDRPRLHFITEANWSEQLNVTAAQRAQVGEISETLDNLSCAARTASRATVFIPLILYLDRVSELGKKLFVPGYDMAVADHYSEFVERDPLYIARNLDYIWRAENLAARGGTFFCNSNTVRQSEILKYIKNLKESSAHVVYVPPNIPDNIQQKLLTEQALRHHFSLQGRYLFYPTQIRPYKNVSTLVRAFAILVAEYPDLKLVLTGDPKDLPEVDQLLTKYELYSRTLLLKNVSEIELYSLYRYAAAVPVPSVFEGGFHYQAIEGLFMEAPVAVADIPIVKERITSLGFLEETCGFPLFSSLDPISLAEKLHVLLEDRTSAVKRQTRFRNALLSYTWRDAADSYYNLFFEKGEAI